MRIRVKNLWCIKGLPTIKTIKFEHIEIFYVVRHTEYLFVTSYRPPYDDRHSGLRFSYLQVNFNSWDKDMSY